MALPSFSRTAGLFQYLKVESGFNCRTAANQKNREGPLQKQTSQLLPGDKKALQAIQGVKCREGVPQPMAPRQTLGPLSTPTITAYTAGGPADKPSFVKCCNCWTEARRGKTVRGLCFSQIYLRMELWRRAQVEEKQALYAAETLLKEVDTALRAL